MSGGTTSLPFCNTEQPPSCLPAAGKEPINRLLFLVLPLLSISFSLLLFLPPQPAFAATVTVNGTAGQSIQGAINAASSGDTIQILPGTYAETLDLQGKTLIIDGAGVDVTIVNASSLTGYAIQNFGDSSAVRDLMLIGTPDNYGFKIAGVSGITLEDIKVVNSKKTGVDLNGVNGGTLADVEVTGTVSGFGINMVDSNDIVLTDITTSNNTWGGVSIQTEGFYYPGGSDNIQFLGLFDASETSPLLLEQDPCRASGGAGGCTEGEYSNITNAQLPSKFAYIFYGLRNPGTEDYKQWFYQETLDDAKSLAQLLMGASTYSGMLIHDTGESNYYVEAGMLIQDAIDASSAGDTISVAAGTYTEQLDIGKDISLVGSGIGTIISSPSTLATSFTTSTTNKAIVHIHGTAAATVRDLTIDGAGLGNTNFRFIGVAFRNAGGVVENSEIKGIRETPLSGTQHGVAIYALNDNGTDRTVTVVNNKIYDYQKNGIALNGANTIAVVSGNNVTGSGPTSLIAQNGIQIGFGASGSVIGNTVNDHFCTEVTTCLEDPTTSPVADGASGILLYASTGTVEVAENTLSGNQFGIWAVGSAAVNIHDNTLTGGSGTGISVWDRDQWTVPLSESAVSTTGSIDDNAVTLHDFAILIRNYNSTEAPYDDAIESEAPNVGAHLNKIANNTEFGAWSNVAMDATNNYWGSATGPFHATENPSGLGDDVSDGVEFKPYYINTALTALSSESQVVADDEVEVEPDTPEVVIPEGLPETTIAVPSTVTDAKINVAALITSSDGTKDATLPKLNINAGTAVGTVQIAIPTGTKVTAVNAWDGTINVPTIKPTSSVTVTPSSDDVEVDEVLTVIEIGFGDVVLDFDKAVRLVIPDMAGNLVGYSRAGTFTPITNVCAADTQAAGDALAAGGDCKINAGSDLAVWTKHFTSFVVYTEAPAAPDGDVSRGRGPVIVTQPPAITSPESHFALFPLDRIQVGSSAFLNAAGVGIAEAKVSQQVNISGTFTNYQETAQNYAFIVQVIDENGFVTDISWQTGTLDSGGTTEVSTLWTPEADGTYTIKIFVWNDVSTSPEPLSDVTVKKIAVTE